MDSSRPKSKNVTGADEMVKPRRATAPTKAKSLERFQYLVGSAAALPLAPQSIPTIVSVHFTDVLPLTAYLPEMIRLVKPSGLFIHFDPLDYHFADVAHHLSGEEIRQIFVDNGFKVVLDTSVQTEHLPLAQSMAYHIYDSWLLGVVRQ